MPDSAHVKDQTSDHGFLIERAENLNRCSWVLEPMLAKRHLKIPVHQMAGSWKVQRLFAVMCAMCLQLTWKNLSKKYRTLTTTLRTYQFGLGKNKVPNESANCWYCILVAIKQILHGFTTSAKRCSGRVSRSMSWLLLHATRQRSVVGTWKSIALDFPKRGKMARWDFVSSRY